MNIIGGGVIGLSIGWQLLRAGHAVTLYDAGEAASRVAAGMLTPYAEAGFEDQQLMDLGIKSLALYPQFLAQLAEDSGISVPLERTGTLIAALDRDDCRVLERIQKSALWLSGDEAREKEPLLSPKVMAALWIEQECHIDTLLLLKALKLAFCKRGGRFIEERVDKIAEKPVVICAGAWSQHWKLPVRPVKGEILTLESCLTLRCMVRTPRIYLVPKANGIVRVGATSEEVGFAPGVKAGAVWQLLEHAWEVVPAVYEMAFKRVEVGFRPVTDDHLPLIKEYNGVYLATGHGRAGILLAPWTARYFMEEVLCKV